MLNSIYSLLFIIVLILLYSTYENFGETTSSVKEIISSYWNKYIHFANKRSKCIDCDNSMPSYETSK